MKEFKEFVEAFCFGATIAIWVIVCFLLPHQNEDIIKILCEDKPNSEICEEYKEE